jgi:hypothetical protein
MYSNAPVFIASTAVCTVPCPVIMIATSCGSISRAARMSAMPSISGIIISAKSRSKSRSFNFSNASLPEAHPTVSYPLSDNILHRTVRSSTSSSTTRRRLKLSEDGVDDRGPDRVGGGIAVILIPAHLDVGASSVHEVVSGTLMVLAKRPHLHYWRGEGRSAPSSLGHDRW